MPYDAQICVLFDRVAGLEAAVAARSPLSEVDRVDLLFDRVAGLEAAVAVRSPLSEVDRVDLLFDRFSVLESMIDGALSERSVEIPWVARSYRGERYVIEVGYAFAEQRYLELLFSLTIPELILLDLNEDPQKADVAGGTAVVADVRSAPFVSGSIDLVLCISTIEHIGRENVLYGTSEDGGRDDPPDIEAIHEMARWLRPGGRLLLSVPFGKFEDHGWLINYDQEHLERLIETSGLTVIDEQYLEFSGGWVPRNAQDIAERGYRSLGAPHAGAVALVELHKESPS